MTRTPSTARPPWTSSRGRERLAAYSSAEHVNAKRRPQDGRRRDGLATPWRAGKGLVVCRHFSQTRAANPPPAVPPRGPLALHALLPNRRMRRAQANSATAALE